MRWALVAAVVAVLASAASAVTEADELKTRSEAIAAVKTKGDVIVVLCTTPKVVLFTLKIYELIRACRRTDAMKKGHPHDYSVL